jgi:hypothetical protein
MRDTTFGQEHLENKNEPGITGSVPFNSRHRVHQGLSPNPEVDNSRENGGFCDQHAPPLPSVRPYVWLCDFGRFRSPGGALDRPRVTLRVCRAIDAGLGDVLMASDTGPIAMLLRRAQTVASQLRSRPQSSTCEPCFDAGRIACHYH